MPRARFQFRLRTLLLVVTLLCISMGIVAHRANRQRRIVAAITSSGGTVFYDFELDDTGHLGDPSVRPPGPAWLRNLVGLDYFATVASAGISAPDGDLVAAVGDLPGLRNLGLANATATDAQWQSLQNLTRLRLLGLIGGNVTDSVLAHIQGLRQLDTLDLEDTHVTDAGLQQIARLPQLEELCLQNTRITDAGLVHLKGLAKLKRLDLRKTAVTHAGVEELQSALPKCSIIR